MRKLLVLAFLAMAFPVAGVCKCANRIIYLKGLVIGADSDGLEIVAETTPDANWEPQPKIKVRHGSFAGEVYFDSFKTREFNDICTRVPESIEIKLLKGKHQLDSTRLDIKKDFVLDDNSWDYKLRSPIEFHLR